MRRIAKWFGRQFQKFTLLPDYFGAIAQSWLDILWGTSVPAIAFLLWWIFGTPPPHLAAVWLVIALFIAGYYAWRADHSRLVPKFSISGLKFQPTPITDKETGMVLAEGIWVQLLPKCLTEAPVEECTGSLREVRRWSVDRREWEETPMNESVRLQWSQGDEKCSPITLEPRNERRLNVFFVANTRNTIFPCVYPLPIRSEAVFESDDTLRFDITIRGKDCPPLDIYMVVKRGDSWDKPTARVISRDWVPPLAEK